LKRILMKRRMALPFSKKTDRAIRDLESKRGRLETPKELLEEIDKTARHLGPEIIDAIRSAYTPFLDQLEPLPAGSTFEDVYLKVHEALGNAMLGDQPFSAVVPVLLQRNPNAQAEHIASGVLIQICNEVFFLTAAHVMDRDSEGELLIPGKTVFIPLTGNFSKMHLPSSGLRLDDKFDVAYCCLESECVSELHPDCRILQRDDVSLEGAPPSRRVYTVCGYPWRRTKTRGRSIDTLLTTLQGYEVGTDVYEKLGLSRQHSIVLWINRKRMMSARLKRTVTPPSPAGMSGGGFYFLESDGQRGSMPRFRLAGITTTFHRDKSLLVATRLRVFVDCIFHNRPELAATAMGTT